MIESYGKRKVIGVGIVRDSGSWGLTLWLKDEGLDKLENQLSAYGSDMIVLAIADMPARSWESARMATMAFDNAEMLLGYSGQDILDTVRASGSLSERPTALQREHMYTGLD